jgi:streptogramin lyase
LPDGAVTTIAGSADPGYVDGSGSTARFFGPTDVAVTSAGSIYVADTFNHRIRVIGVDGVVSTVAGGVAGYADGTGTSAQFSLPAAIAELDGILYVADGDNAVIRTVNLTTRDVATLAGSAGVAGLEDGVGSAARFDLPYGVDVDPTTRTLWIVDKNNAAIRTLDLGTGAVHTLAGDGTLGAEDGVGAAAHFNSPSGIALDGMGGAWIADTGNSVIRHIAVDGTVTTAAGAAMSSGFIDGPPRTARLDRPWGITMTTGGDVVFTEQYNSTIRALTPGVEVHLIAGQRWDGSDPSAHPPPRDGPAAAAILAEPTGLAIQASGDLVFSDHHALRRVSGWR